MTTEPHKKEYRKIGASAGAMDIDLSKIMKRRGGGHAVELGDHEGVGILEKFLFYVV